jgi:hypothetical protein
MPSLSQTAPPTPTAIVARRPPKVSKIGSQRRLNAIGENLIENHGSERRIGPPPVSRHRGPAAPPTGVAPSCPLADQCSGLEVTVPLQLG